MATLLRGSAVGCQAGIRRCQRGLLHTPIRVRPSGSAIADHVSIWPKRHPRQRTQSRAPRLKLRRRSVSVAYDPRHQTPPLPGNGQMRRKWPRCLTGGPLRSRKLPIFSAIRLQAKWDDWTSRRRSENRKAFLRYSEIRIGSRSL